MPASQMVTGGLVAVILFLITTPFLRYSFRKKDPQLVNLVTLALAVKLLASIARYLVASQVYGGRADSEQYYTSGAQLAPHFRQLNFHADVGKVAGTGFIKILTGVIFAVTGVSKIGGYFVIAWVGFLGLWLFFRAFRIAVPEGKPRTYALLLFFLPSMVFWPSALGKDGWMTMGLGLMAYGAARVLARMRFGYLLILLGALATAMVRPHVTALFVAALFVAYLVRRNSTLPAVLRGRGRVKKLVGITVLVVALVVGTTRTQSFFKSDNLKGGNGSVTGVLSATAVRTSQGGSQFKPASFTSPASIPVAVLSTTFRPFPWEAHNLQSFLAAGEGVFLLYLIWRNRRQWRRLPRWVVRRPYVMLCLVYSVLFAFAFSAVGNFGILDRQRVQQLPFVVALFALPLALPGEEEAEGQPAEEQTDTPGQIGRRLQRPGLATTPLAGRAELLPRPPQRLSGSHVGGPP